MANISETNGTLFLQGDWTQEALDAFYPVLDSLYFEQYGIESFDCEPTLDYPQTNFSGNGRWDFSSILASFGDGTWYEIRNSKGHALSAEQYRLFLKRMAEQNLSIRLEFDDEDESMDIDYHETGILTSDGEKLVYKTLSSKNNEPDWRRHSRNRFDNAVNYFWKFVPDEDKHGVMKWVKEYHKPPKGLDDISDDVACGQVSVEDVLSFQKIFKPKTKQWEKLLEFFDADFLEEVKNGDVFSSLEIENKNNEIGFVCTDKEGNELQLEEIIKEIATDILKQQLITWTQADEAWYQNWDYRN